MMKRITALLLTIVLSQFIIAPIQYASAASDSPDTIESYKDVPGVTDEEIAQIEALINQRGGFTYGHLLETEAFMRPDGTYAGFTIEFCKLLTSLFGAEFTPTAFESWTDMRKALDNYEVDFSGGMAITEERLNSYYMTIPIAGRALKTYTLKDEEIATAVEFEGRVIGSLYGTVLADAVKERYPGYSFKMLQFDTYADGVALLEEGKIDAIIATEAADPRLEIYDNIASKDLFTLAYYPISVSTAEPELAPVISVINKYLESGGINKVFALYEEGRFEYKKFSLSQSLTGEEKEYLHKMLSLERKVNIGLQHDAYPASFYNEAEKEFQGVSIDILKEITRLTGLRFEPLSTSETTPLATILEKLKKGEISMMTQLLKTESRKDDYIWSNVPYLTTNYALLSRIDYPKVEIYQVTWERVGTINKSAHEVMFDSWFPEHRNRIKYNTTNEGFDALERGEIDLLMLSENMLLQQTNLRQKTGFKVNIRFDVELDSYFGFSKNEELLCSIVDKSMGYINIGEIASVWMNKVFDYESELARVQNTFLVYFVGAMLAALIIVVYLLMRNQRLGRKLLERTSTLTALYTSIPDSIFCKNADGQYTSCNPSFERQAGLTEKEIIGKTYAEVFKDRVSDKVDIYKEIDKEVITKHITNITEELVIFPDGSLRTLDMLKAPLFQNGTVVGIFGIGRDITERAEIKNRMESIINTAQIAFILTVDGIVAVANKYVREHVGIEAGDDIRDIYDDPKQRAEILELAEREGTSTNYVVSIKIANGEVHRFLTSVTKTDYERQKAHIVWALDIERDKKTSDMLRETQLSFQTVLDTLPMPIRIVDLATHEIVYVNGSLAELLGYASPEEVCGLKISQIVPRVLSDGTQFSEREEQLMAEGVHHVSVDMEYLTKTGEIIEAVVVARNIDYKGRRSSIGIIKDLTEEKRMAQVLREAAENEKEANQAKSMFLANMSHEIRTPMNGIIGMTDLLLNEKLSARQQQYAKDIKVSAESLLGIINDILDLSKITEGKLQIIPVDVDLRLLLENTVSLMRFTAQRKGLRFIDELLLKTHEYVRIDDVRINQIIVNLLSNAIKFTKSGFVKLRVAIEGDRIQFEISDTGIGIKEEDIPLIFSAFEQADRQKNRAIKGTGLGLSITKNLVELLDGEMWVESRYGSGSTFYVTVPYIQGDETAVQPADSKFEYIFAPSAQILLVDDIQTNLTVGSGLLRMCGITADVAISGHEALERVKEKDYDIVFMDHMMPEMDGIDTMNEIRKYGDKYKSLTIIALTANAVTESKNLLLSSGMNDFLPKPIDKIELMNILKKWLPPEKIKSVSERAEQESEIQYTETLAAASKVKGLDIDLALSRIGGLQEVLENSIKQVAFSIDDNLRRMDNCLALGDLSNFAMNAHGLKGALANIGAMKNSELAAGLEIGAKVDNMPLCVEKFTVFASTMRTFAHDLKNVFEAEEQTQKQQGDKAFLAEKIDEAIGYLEIFEAAEALDCFAALSAFTYGMEIDAGLSEAKGAAERYSYEDAIDLLNNIKGAL